jgi:hypothetical protein
MHDSNSQWQERLSCLFLSCDSMSLHTTMIIFIFSKTFSNDVAEKSDMFSYCYLFLLFNLFEIYRDVPFPYTSVSQIYLVLWWNHIKEKGRNDCLVCQNVSLIKLGEINDYNTRLTWNALMLINKYNLNEKCVPHTS